MSPSPSVAVKGEGDVEHPAGRCRKRGRASSRWKLNSPVAPAAFGFSASVNTGSPPIPLSGGEQLAVVDLRDDVVQLHTTPSSAAQAVRLPLIVDVRNASHGDKGYRARAVGAPANAERLVVLWHCRHHRWYPGESRRVVAVHLGRAVEKKSSSSVQSRAADVEVSISGPSSSMATNAFTTA